MIIVLYLSLSRFRLSEMLFSNVWMSLYVCVVWCLLRSSCAAGFMFVVTAFQIQQTNRNNIACYTSAIASSQLSSRHLVGVQCRPRSHIWQGFCRSWHLASTCNVCACSVPIPLERASRPAREGCRVEGDRIGLAAFAVVLCVMLRLCFSPVVLCKSPSALHLP